jgi:hypothetical protein
MHNFMRQACLLGANPATWTRYQFVRMPDGWREEKDRRQGVVYFDPRRAKWQL